MVNREDSGQTAVEYLLLLAVVVAVILVGFRDFLPRSYQASGQYFNGITIGIMGTPNRCGDGFCDDYFEIDANKCCVDCGGC